jgi:hypothetical protein
VEPVTSTTEFLFISRWDGANCVFEAQPEIKVIITAHEDRKDSLYMLVPFLDFKFSKRSIAGHLV